MVSDTDWLVRTRLLVGDAAIGRLQACHVLLAGVGGVGGHVAEAVARAGVGRITLIDMDYVALSNLNRQLVATTSTMGMAKAEVMKTRILTINPDCRVDVMVQMVCQDAYELLSALNPDYVVDAIDSVNCKVALLQAAQRLGISTFSSMGAGRRLDVRAVRLCDLMETSGCALARVVRQRLRKAGIGKGIKVVTSDELPRAAGPLEPAGEGRMRAVNGTVSYMPALFGTLLAGELIRSIVES
ncbi:MAG: tRNA threonylcarbamoyladenosine dehydratase [Gammaproteobacteria bacterium]|nr:tRNA threonylcarbamoyladenosine dehydratase [Gammaproteobacteria bacterium]